MDEGARGLVLEDNPFMRRLLIELLREMGVRDVAAVTNTPQALREMDANMFDFALVDVGLEQESGLDFIRNIRLDRANPQRRMPMVVVSGQSQKAVIEAARDAGANDFLIKPVSVAALESRLSRAIVSPPAFIETPDYYGPDRRRTWNTRYEGLERRRKLRL